MSARRIFSRLRPTLGPALERDRRGAAVAVIVLLILAVTGLGLLTMRQGQQNITLGVVNTDSQRALEVADACAAAAVKTLPMLLETYIMYAREGTGSISDLQIVPEQFGFNFFGTDPYGPNSVYAADCNVRIVDIADDVPAPGYSEGGGCFKRVSLEATAQLFRNNPSLTESSDVMQHGSETVRQVLVRGLFGPTSCF